VLLLSLKSKKIFMEKALKDIPVSMLDFATIVEGDQSVADAFKRSLSFAKHAERSGYKRYWFAEHHNMESVASAATSVLIGFVAGHTSSIRVGAGGIMLPNHAPLIIAEQFGTLEALYPGRIDLGIGRAPGTDPLTSEALRRNLKGDIDNFPSDVVELINYLGPRDENAKVRAIPGEGAQVPVWMLGSSTYSAQVAGMLGLPFAFASHFAPTYLHHALDIYRSMFRPSGFLQQPHAMACVNVIVGETDEEAQRLATSFYQLALGMFRKDRRPLPKPVPSMDGVWTEIEKQGVLQMMQYSFIGSRESVHRSLQGFIEKTKVDELMIATHIHSEKAKTRSMELARSLFSDPVTIA
jgi:luciferase family oxidoreductase group 1